MRAARSRAVGAATLAALLLGCAAAPPSPAVRGGWEVRYVPGRAELPWFHGGPIDGRICDVAAEPTMVARQREALQAATALRLAPHAFAATSLDARSALSHLVACPRGRAAQPGACRVEPIEPLHAFGRHPFAEVGCLLGERATGVSEVTIFDIDYLVLASRCEPEQPPTQPPGLRLPGGGGGGGGGGAPPRVHTGRSLLFDAGCSVWGRGKRGTQPLPPPGQSLGASALGPSMPLFMQLYARQCVHFDAIYGWEARTFEPNKWWQHVPADVRTKLHFYNVPITNGGPADPLLAIGLVARVDDFVVLKLDIDTYDVERAVMEEIRTNARRTNASLLIDELFFEYHFLTPAEPKLMRFWPTRTRGGSIDDAMALMQQLREKGVRTHFWI